LGKKKKGVKTTTLDQTSLLSNRRKRALKSFFYDKISPEKGEAPGRGGSRNAAVLSFLNRGKGGGKKISADQPRKEEPTSIKRAGNSIRIYWGGRRVRSSLFVPQSRKSAKKRRRSSLLFFRGRGVFFSETSKGFDKEPYRTQARKTYPPLYGPGVLLLISGNPSPTGRLTSPIN